MDSSMPAVMFVPPWRGSRTCRISFGAVKASPNSCAVLSKATKDTPSLRFKLPTLGPCGVATSASSAKQSFAASEWRPMLPLLSKTFSKTRKRLQRPPRRYVEACGGPPLPRRMLRVEAEREDEGIVQRGGLHPDGRPKEKRCNDLRPGAGRHVFAHGV